jgi:drug/metabolite transporter (DMT)-like permease
MNVPATPSPTGRGIASMILGMALLTTNDSILKWLTTSYPVGQVLFMRGIFVFVPVAFFVWRAGGLDSLRIRNYRGQAARAAMAVGSSYVFVIGLSLLPIADAIAISFAGPLFITALATPLLGERVGWRRWVAVMIGFAGVLVMIRPIGDMVRMAALLPLSAACIGAFRDIVTRGISRTDTSVSILTVSTVAVTLSGLFSLPHGWRTPVPMDIGLLALAGLLLGSAHFFMIEAYRQAEAAVVAPFKYTSMIWALLAGFLVWGDIPDGWTFAGSALVIASGLYILHRKTRR